MKQQLPLLKQLASTARAGFVAAHTRSPMHIATPYRSKHIDITQLNNHKPELLARLYNAAHSSTTHKLVNHDMSTSKARVILKTNATSIGTIYGRKLDINLRHPICDSTSYDAHNGKNLFKKVAQGLEEDIHLPRSDCDPQMVRLRNGSQAPRVVAEKITQNLSDILQQKRGIFALNELRAKCRNAEHIIVDEEVKLMLKDKGLLTTSNEIPTQVINDIILSSVRGDNINILVTSPYAIAISETEASLGANQHEAGGTLREKTTSEPSNLFQEVTLLTAKQHTPAM
tara:strand:- start:559 stop:1416 length:858 start_codon:yes stop_codon:yes gene_type:complete